MLPQYSKAEAYIQAVCAQIRWKKAHAIIETELLAHIEDQKEALLAEGMIEDEAETMAVAEMGSPVETGSGFDRLYRPRIQWSVLLFAGLLLALGIIVRLSLLAALGEPLPLMQTLWVLLVGLVMMALGYWLDYTALLSGGRGKLIVVLFLAAYIALFFCYSPLGPVEDGVWTKVSCLALFFPPLFCVFLYLQRGKKLEGIAALFFQIILFANMFMMAKNGAALLILGSGFFILLYAVWQNWFGCKRWLGLLIFFSLLTAFTLFFQFLFQKGLVQRLWANMSPFLDADALAAAAKQVQEVVHSAGWIGAGTVDLPALAANMPHLSSDYLLTAMLGHWGWLPIILVLLAYVAMICICCFACSKVKSVFGKLVAAAILSSWMMQIFLYGLTNLTAIQIAAYPLLFVEGDVELVCNLFLLGLLLSVYKTGAVETNKIIADRNGKSNSKVQSFWDNAARQFSNGMDRIYQSAAKKDMNKKL